MIMRKLFAAVAVLGVLFVSACGSSSSAQAVNVNEFVSAMGQPGVTVLDVRHIDEYAAGHVDGAINIDVEGTEGTFDAAIAELDKNGTYLIYCHSGRRAQIAADAMADAGFTKLTNLAGGGFAELASAGVPTAVGP